MYCYAFRISSYTARQSLTIPPAKTRPNCSFGIDAISESIVDIKRLLASDRNDPPSIRCSLEVDGRTNDGVVVTNAPVRLTKSALKMSTLPRSDRVMMILVVSLGTKKISKTTIIQRLRG